MISVAISIPLGIIFGHSLTWKNHNLPGDPAMLPGICPDYASDGVTVPRLFRHHESLWLGPIRELASVIVFTVWGAAEMSDLVRGSLISIPIHQYESAEALGLSRIQSYQYIVLPAQAVRRLIPLSINLITRMIKTTSLILMMIGVVEVLEGCPADYRGKTGWAVPMLHSEFITVFFLYFIACWPISLLAKYLENDGGEMSESVLTIEHLTKQFDNSTVLNDLSLQIHEGEVVVIVGPSGWKKVHTAAVYQCPGGHPKW